MKSIRLYTGVVFCAALLWIATPVNATSAAAEQLLVKARSLEGRGRLDLAARAWEQILLADPNNSEALLGLAKYAKQNGKLEEADGYLKRLKNLDPSNPAIGAVEGMKSAGKQRSAIEEASRLAEKQNFEGAMRIYRSLFGNEPPPGSVGIAYYETEASIPGGWKDAVAGLERLAIKYPQSEEYRLSLGRLKTYREPTRMEGMEILAALKPDTPLSGKARAAWRQALIWSAGSPASLPSLHAYLSRYSDPELEKLTAQTSKTPEPASHPPIVESADANAGYSLLNEQKLDEAEKHFQLALRSNPHSPAALAGMGYVRMKQEDFHTAAEYFDQALRTQPKNKNVTEALATSRFWEQMKAGGEEMDHNRPEAAIGHFENALAMRPESEQATESLAGAYLTQQQPAKARPLFEKLTGLKPQSADYWYGLVKATYQTSNAEAALADLKQVPPHVREEWENNPERLALLSFIYADAGLSDESRRTFERANAAAHANKTEIPAYQQMEFARRTLREQHKKEAAAIFLQVAAKHPSNIEAWTGAISALLNIPDSPRAYEVLQRIPQSTFALALANTDFLRTVARLQTSMKRYDLAEKCLNEAASIDSSHGKQPDLDTQLQFADLAVHREETMRAEKLLRSLTEEYASDKRAWIALVGLLHEEKADAEAVAQIEKMPESVSVEAQSDPGFVVLEASVYTSDGNTPRALSLVRNAQKQFETARRGAPVALDIQLAWLLMDNQDSQVEVSKILDRDNLRSDLTPTERHDLNQVSSVWAQRRAQAALEAKDTVKAISILQSAATSLPDDPRIQAMLASVYLREEDFPKAFAVYRHWDLKGALVDDFRGAIGAASAAHENNFATKWLALGLQEYPTDPRLLQLAGEQAAEHKDYQHADYYLRQALAKLPTDDSSPQGSRPVLRQQTRQSNGRVSSLASDTDIAAPGPGVSTISTAPINSHPGVARPLLISAPSGMTALEGGSADSDDDSHPLLFNRAFAAGHDPIEKNEPGLIPAVQPEITTPNAADQAELRAQIQTELEAIDGRNAPYFQNGVNLQQRSGEGGFDKLLIEEAPLVASTTMANRIRFTIMATPTYVDSGSAASPAIDGHLGFGTVPVDATPGARSAFGIGGEFQLSTTNLGLRFGVTPQEFLVHGWTGGLRWNPASGPFTIIVNRDPLRDTKLSFAGERDPNSQLIWGGVMANSAAALGNWSHGHTGYYAKLDYQDIEGLNVAKNSRIEATAGSFFQAYRNHQGTLTLGLNLTGLHYDKNLRYFTLGQGGYFSPQEYFLFNVPLRWTSTVNRQFQYSISASLGLQHFSEDASPYFPTDAARQALSGLFYPTYTNTGSNYNLDFHTIYQITPQWLGGFYFDINNSREYRSVVAGLYLKYLIRPRPSAAGLNLTAVPDWNGISPFKVP